MKLAIVAGGWHYPMHFYRECARLASGADLFCIAHRSPKCREVREEKRTLFYPIDSKALWAQLQAIDQDLYREVTSISVISDLGWNCIAAPNVAGDWYFFNQWLEMFDYRKYDVILNCHDDTYLRPGKNVFRAMWEEPFGSWMMLANGRYPESPVGYVRGSFEFWRRELLDLLGGKIPMPELSLTREGLTDSPKDFTTLMPWNAIGDPLRKFLVERKLTDRVAFLSSHYRVSEYVIECERGLISSNVGSPWSYIKGLEAYPL